MADYSVVSFIKDDLKIDVRVSPSEETVWMTKEQMSILFGRDRSVISKHIRNIYLEGEIDEQSTCAKNAHMKSELRNRFYEQELFNLDVIISVGYRVKSKNGVLFRKWAINVLKEYLIKGYVIDENRTLITNENYVNLIHKVESIDERLLALEKINIEKEKIFFDGQLLDAKAFISRIVSNAKSSIVLIDAYADAKALDLLKCKKPEVNLLIYRSTKAKLSIQDVDDFNSQYGRCSVFINNKYHDRFLIIDDNDIYHLGSSLNYAGKKAFAITKMEDKRILESIKGNLKNE